VDPVSRTITIRAVLPNDDARLMPGMFMTVSLLKDDVVALMIPEQAIVPERSTSSPQHVSRMIEQMQKSTTGKLEAAPEEPV